MENTVFLTYIVKPFFSIKDISSQPLVFITCTPALTIPVFSTSIKAFILLACLFIIDFITGIAASCIEFRKSRKPERGKKYIIESSKMRLSAVKFSTYGIGILIAYGLEWVFILEDFNLHSNLHKISLSTLITAFFVLSNFIRSSLKM